MSRDILKDVAKAIGEIQYEHAINSFTWGEHNEWTITYTPGALWTAYHDCIPIATIGPDANHRPVLRKYGGRTTSEMDVINSMCNWFGTKEKVSLVGGGIMHTVPRRD